MNQFWQRELFTHTLYGFKTYMSLLIVFFILITGCTLCKKDPMINYVYTAEDGDYYNELLAELKKSNFSPEEHRLNRFPIHYWIQEMDSDKKAIIISALEEYKQYFPMKETNNKEDANLIIEITTFEFCDKLMNEEAPDTLNACGNIEYRQPHSRGNVRLLNKVFNYKPLAKRYIMHEIGHAMGLDVHTDDPSDIMYFGDIYYDPEDDEIVVGDTIQTVDAVGTFSNRDLNTLWKLYK